MTSLIVTALFDINRSTKGDGRTIEDYLNWFEKTLNLKCDFIIFTEHKFENFIKEKRKHSDNKTFIITQKLEDIPFYHQRDNIISILSSPLFRSKINDLSRIECYLPEYNIIQYSKFGWLKISSEKLEYDNYLWMDAGCSRFFEDFDLNKSWPDYLKLEKNKITIQGNNNYVTGFEKMIPDEYIWDNNSMLVGTLFGGNKYSINILYNSILNLFERYYNNGCINNEQFLLAILAKENNELFNIKYSLNSGHLPLFRMIS
jgi:hypothetical protein